MGVLIDTSVFVAIERAQRDLSSSLAAVDAQAPALSAITASELLHGVHRTRTPTQKQRRSQFVETVLSHLPVLDFDLESARIHSEIWARLKAQGRMIGPHDLLIAATALRHDHSVWTCNEKHFRSVPGLSVIPWN